MPEPLFKDGELESIAESIKSDIARGAVEVEQGYQSQLQEYAPQASGFGESMFDLPSTPITTLQEPGGLQESRAQAQPSVAKLGAGLVNAITRTGLDVIKDSSYLLDPRNIYDFQNQAEKGFNNFIAEAMTKVEESLEVPVYRTKASEGFSPLSAGFWGENMPSIMSTISMAIPAQAGVMGLSKLGKAMGGKRLIETIETASGTRGLSDMLKGTTGAVLSRQMENLMEGGQTYQETYQKAIEAGKTDTEAKTIAGQAASDNYKLNWINLITDIPQYMLLNKSFSKSLDDLKFSKADIAKNVVGESAEEQYQFITNEEAKRKALIDSGAIKDDNSSFSDRLGNYVKDEEFWTASLLGGLGGGIFSAAGNYSNSKRQVKEKEIFDNLTNLHTAVVKRDSDDFNRKSDDIFSDMIITHLGENRTEDLREALNDTTSLAETPEELKDTRTLIRERNQILDFSENLYNELTSDQSKSAPLKAAELDLGIRYKLGANRLQNITKQLNRLNLEHRSTSLYIDPALDQLKEVKLQAESIKDIPYLKEQYDTLSKQVDKNYKTILDEGFFSSKKAIDRAIVSPNDKELTRLYQNQAIENHRMKFIKDNLYELSTSDGIKKFEKNISDLKEAQEEETKKAAIAEEKLRTQEKAKAKAEQNREEIKTQEVFSQAEKVIETPTLTQEELDEIDSPNLIPTEITPESVTIAQPELPDFTSASVQTRIDQTEDKYREYQKSKSTSFAYLSFAYQETETESKTTLQTIYTENGIPIQDQSDIRLSSPTIGVGSEFEVKVDTSYKDFEKLKDNKDTIPIGVYVKGETSPIAYVHTPEWVSKNIQEQNISQVLEDTRKIRDAALQGAEIVITAKSVGRLNSIENQGTKNNQGYINKIADTFGTQSSIPNQFGDSRIIIAESDSRAIIGKDTISDKNIVNEMYPGAIYMEIPTSLEDTYFSVALRVNNLSTLNQSDVIVNAIKSFLTKQGLTLNGHNLNTIKGLNDFINEITFVGKGTKRSAKTFDINLVEDTLYLNIGATADIGFDLTSTPGGLITKFNDIQDNIRTVLNSKFFNVDKNKLDSKQPFTVYKTEGENIVPDKEYKNYSEYLSDKVLLTNIHPQITPSGERTFFHQSVISYALKDESLQIIPSEKQIDEAIQAAPVKEIKPSEPSKTTKKYDDVDETGLSELDDSDNIQESPTFERTDLKFYRIQDLNLEQQNDITNSIVSLLLKEIEASVNPSIAFTNILKKFKGEYNKSIDAGNETKANILKLVIDNWSITPDFTGFTNLAEIKLSQLSTRIDGDQVEFEEGGVEKRNFSEDSTFKTNPKDTASGRLKAFLTFIPRKDRKSILGKPAYYDFNELYNEIMSYLSDTEFEDMPFELQELASTKPQYQTVIDKLAQQDKSIQNEFYSNFKKRYSEQVQLSFDISSNGVSAFTRSSNRNSLSSTILAQWEENLKSSDLLSQISEGENIGSTKIDVTKANSVFDEFKAITELKAIQDTDITKLAEVFSKVGINISEAALKDLRTAVYITKPVGERNIRNPRKELAYKNLQSFLNTKISRIFSKLTEDKEDALFEDNNPFIDEQDSLRILARFQKKYETQLQSSSYRDALGNTIFAYNNPTYETNQLIKLKSQDNEAYLDSLLSTAFSSTSDYAKQLKDHSSALYKTFNISRFDATRKSRSNEEALEYSDMSTKIRELTKLWLFQNQGLETANILDVTYSDKKIINTVSVPKVDITNWENTESTAFKMLRNLAIGELLRIKQTQLQIDNLPKEELIDKYHTTAQGGLISYLFPSLNNSELFQEGRRKLKEEYLIGPFVESYPVNGTLLPEVRRIVDEVILNEVKSWIETKSTKLKAEGITEIMFDKSYLYKKKTGVRSKVEKKSDMFDYSVADYVINYAITVGNLTQIMNGDIALAGKKGAKTEGYIRNTYVEYFKRMAKNIAPGIEFKSNTSKAKVLYVNDVQIETEASKRFDKKLESTDAQGIVTTKFYITKLFERGQVSKQLKDSILDKINKFPDTYDSEFTKEEQGVILQPRKPVYVQGNIENGINSIVYLKFSDYPLLPSITKGTNIDQIRKSMETDEIDMLVFKSAAKLGSKNPVSFYNNETGEFIAPTDLKQFVSEIDSSGFRIQQDNPLKDENKIIESTQQKKLLFVDIPNDTKFGDKTKTELKQEYDSKHIELVNLKFESLLKRFNATQLENTEYQINDLTKLQEFIKESAIEKGWNPNELAMVELSEDKLSFKVPLIYANSTEKIESLLTSLLTNNLIRVKLPGKSYIQASSIGYEKVGNNVITNPALKYMIEDKTGFYSETIISWPYTDLKYSDYVNEDGTPKNNISDELLYTIGYRIPNQGHNSMIRLKIIKFLPPQMGDLMFVPSEVTMQMGSDFDVDKMNTYMVHHEVKDNKLRRYTGDDVIKNIENDIVTINHIVLSNSEVSEMIRQPLDSEDLKTVVDEVETILQTDKQVTSILNDELSDKALVDNRSGKLLTALTSLSATNHALSQEAELFITPVNNETPAITVSFKKDSGELYPEATRLDKIYGFTKRLISKVISGLQSAAVDNAKEQLLGKANLNNQTYSVADFIVRSGFDESFLIPFLKQESIIELVKRLERYNDPTEEVMSRKRIDDIKDELLSEYEKLSETIDKNEIKAFSRVEMREFLKQSLSKTKDKEYYKVQAQILNNFLQYEKVAKELTSLKAALSPESKGAGKSITEMIFNQDRIERATISFKHLANTPNFFKNTPIANTLDKAIFEGNQLYKNLYPYIGKAYSQFYQNIQTEFGDDRILSLENKEEINRELRSAIYSKFYSDVKSERARLLIDDFTIDPKTNTKSFKNKSAAQRILEYTGNNKFFRKLKTDLTTKSGEPSYVIYFSSASEEEGEALENSIAWQEALTSTNESERLLGEDLVKYAYLTGGVQTKTGFVKYVPTDYIQSKLTGNSFTDLNDPSAFDFIVRQYFQHRPWRAKRVSPTFSEVILPKKSLDNGKIIGIPDSFTVNNKSPKSVSVLISKGGNSTFPQFLSVKLDRKWQLYEMQGRDKNQAKYERIGILGGFNFKEYDITKEYVDSITETNNTKRTIPEAAKGVDLSSTTIKTESEEIKDSKLIQSIKTNNISDVIDEIVKADIPQSALAKYLSDKVQGVNIYEDPIQNVDRKGYKAGDSVYINIDYLKGDSSEMYDTILHELMHVLTSSKLNLYKTDRGQLTQAEINSIESLDRLRSVTKARLPKKSEKYDYALGTIDEFISYAFTDSEFQKDLNSIEFNTKQSLLDRFFELISRLLGIDITPGSVLQETASHVLNIIEKNSSNTINMSPTFLSQLKKDIGWYKTEVSELQKNLILKRLGLYNLKNGTHHSIQWTRIGTSDIWTGEFTDNYINIQKSPIFAKEYKVTGDPNLDKILNRWRNQKRLLEQQKTLNKEQASNKQREIDEINREIETLLDKKDLDTVLDRAKIQLRQVDNILSKDINTAETLKKALNYISGWEDINNIFTFQPETEEAKVIGDIVVTASNLRNKWSETAKTFLTNLTKEQGLSYTKKDLFEGNFDTSLAESLFFDSSVSTVPLEVLIDQIYKKTIFEANDEISKKHKEIDEKFKPIKDKATLLIQTRIDGSLTGNLVSKYKQEYFDKIIDLRNQAKKDPKRWRDYWTWVKENSYILSTEETLKGESKQFSQEEIKKAKELLDQYDKDFNNFKEAETERLSYSELYINKENNSQQQLDYERNLAENIGAWEIQNSPYLREQFEREVNLGDRKARDLRNMKGYKYLLYPKPIEKWEDPKYKIVENDPELFEFYNYFKDTVEEYLKNLPGTNDVQSNTIPELKLNTREAFLIHGFTGAYRSVSSYLIESVTTDQLSEKEYGVIDEETGKPVRVLRGGMLSNQLSPYEKSYNLQRVLKEFVSLGATVKHKANVESQLQIGEKMLLEVTENLKGPNGAKSDWQNKIIKLSNGLDNTRKRVSYLLDTFYGMRKDLEGKKEIKSGPLKGKTLVGSKVVDNINQYTVAKGLSLNPFSGAVNLFFANISNRIEAAGGRLFNDKDLNRAEAIMYSSIFNRPETKKKIALLMEKLQVLGDVNQANYGEKSIYDWTFFMQRMGEYAGQGNSMIASLIHNSLWDNIKVDGDNLVFPKDVDVFKLSLKVQQTNKYLHGNYQLNSPTLIKKQAWGRMLMVFRSWVPYTLKNRFGKEFYDESLGQTRKGRYITYADLGFKRSIQNLFKLSLLGRLTGQSIEDVSEVDLANMKQNLRELSYMASFYLVTMMMKAMAGDLDDDEDELFNYALNTAMRTEADLWFFVSPKAFSTIARDPIPPLKTAEDFLNLINSTGNFIIGDDEIKSGRNKGESKLARDFQKSFPISSQIVKVESAMEQVFTDKPR